MRDIKEIEEILWQYPNSKKEAVHHIMELVSKSYIKKSDVLEMIEEQKHKTDCKEVGCTMTYNQALSDLSNKIGGKE